MKPVDFRDAVRLMVMSLAKRFNRPLTVQECNEYLDDLFFELPPKALAQIPGLLAIHRREGLYFPSTGQIRQQVKGRPAAVDQATVKLLARPDKPEGWEDMSADQLHQWTATLLEEARARRAAQPIEQPVLRSQKERKSSLMPIGAGMSEKQFKDLIESQKRAHATYNQKPNKEK